MENKRIDHISKIMSKRHGIFTENLLLFSNAGKTFRRQSFEDDINETLHQPVPWILKNFIFYKFYPIKRIYLSEKIPYLAKTFNCSSPKQEVCVCVVFHWKQMLKVIDGINF